MTDETIQTGPMKISNDWTGIFIRGKDALSLVRILRTLAADANERARSGQIDPNQAIQWVRLTELADLLESCREKQP